MFRKEGIRLSPHHLINVVDCYKGAKFIADDIEFHWKGPWVRERVEEVLERVRIDPEVRVRLVNNPKKEFICSGNRGDNKCIGVSNPFFNDCSSRGNKKQEAGIAADMGLKIGKLYPFSELIERRERTSFGKD